MTLGRTTIWLVCAVLALTAAAASGQAGYIGLYADAGGAVCSVHDQGAGQVNVYVLHQASAGAVASQWKLVPGAGFAMTYVGESWSIVAMGDTQNGVAASYGDCLSSPILLCTVTYATNGMSASCSHLSVVPDPNSFAGVIEVTDCSSQTLTATGGRLYVNPNDSCPCGLPNPVEDSDWGRIKAMFAE
jgi:hypothetical protein